MDIYTDILHDHYRFPRNQKVIESPDLESECAQPSCGDIIKYQAQVKNNTITDIGFSGSGCIISVAMASILSEYVISKTLKDIQNMNSEDVKNLIGISLGPVRLKCALLPLQTLQQAVKLYVLQKKEFGKTES